MDRKKVIYIGLVLILTVIISITYFSYAFFTHRDEQRGKLNIITGTLNYKIESEDLNNNQITLAANTTKKFEIVINSLNNIDSRYELYYETSGSNIEVGYSNASIDLPTGIINANSQKKVLVRLTNNSNSAAAITFGVIGGFAGNSLVKPTGTISIPALSASCNVAVNTVTLFPYNGNDGTNGSKQQFVTPCTGSYKVELWGAQGGEVSSTYYGGNGTYTSGIIQLEDNQTINVYVGGKGQIGSTSVGGYNGGGASSAYHSYTMNIGSGGGATDIRYNDTSLNARVMVAAGGGGADYTVSDRTFYYSGGHGGGLSGEAGGVNYSCVGSNCITSGTGGTQTAPGANQYSASYVTASFGIGGTPYDGSSHTGPGGGAGYYGGGGGAWATGGAGGGSSYISGHAGCIAIAEGSTSNPRVIKSGCTSSSTSLECSIHYSGLYFTETNMIDGAGHTWTTIDTGIQSNNLMPNPEGGYYASGTGHTGNGYARITYLGD